MTTSPTGPTNRSHRGGFTLLELIVVLVLLSTVLAIAAPSLRGFVRGRQTANAAATVLALTHLARSRAASWGCVHRLNLDDQTGECWLTMQQGGAFVAIEGSQGQRVRLPGGVSVAVVSSATDAEATESYVQFYPDGRCDPATILLTGGQDDAFEVTCRSVSQRFHIAAIDPEDAAR